jgi:hypothetical protein
LTAKGDGGRVRAPETASAAACGKAVFPAIIL